MNKSKSDEISVIILRPLCHAVGSSPTMQSLPKGTKVDELMHTVMGASHYHNNIFGMYDKHDVRSLDTLSSHAQSTHSSYISFTLSHNMCTIIIII